MVHILRERIAWLNPATHVEVAGGAGRRSLPGNAVDLHSHSRRIERHAEVFEEAMATEEGWNRKFITKPGEDSN